jgi:hypothetical protein
MISALYNPDRRPVSDDLIFHAANIDVFLEILNNNLGMPK